MFHDSGLAGTQDYAEAAAWYRKAAEMGHNTAQNNLGLLYALGQGVRQDFSEAYFWLALAVVGREGAKRDKAIESRDYVASQLKPNELKRAQQLVATWIAAHPAQEYTTELWRQQTCEPTSVRIVEETDGGFPNPLTYGYRREFLRCQISIGQIGS